MVGDNLGIERKIFLPRDPVPVFRFFRRYSHEA
jgi:hypothetical protein